MQLSIIIVSYNVKYFLEQCLASVHAAIRDLETEVWVVDNASSDNSAWYLKAKFPWVRFFENVENVGFAKANNQALYQCKGEFILFLNPDTLVADDAFKKSIGFMQANRQAGALGIRMIDGNGSFLPESKRSFPSPLTSFYKLVGLSRLFPSSSVFSRYSLGHLEQHKNHEVDVLSGAFMLARKDVLIELKGFDEAFFMYGEDIDLSYRIQKLGYKNYYFSESTVIHFKGESTRKGSLKYVKMFYTAMSIFVKKHTTGPTAFLNSFLLDTAIWLRASASVSLSFAKKSGVLFTRGFYTFFRAKKGSTSLKKQVKKTIVLGTAEDYEEVITLLANAGGGKKIIGHISINETNGSKLENTKRLHAAIKSNNVNEIIFCQGDLAYRWIIDRLEELQLHKTISVRFHGRGTDSIVGSDSKNSTGEFVAANSSGV